MIILGLDPGLGTTGWGVIRADGNRGPQLHGALAQRRPPQGVGQQQQRRKARGQGQRGKGRQARGLQLLGQRGVLQCNRAPAL